jgi:hypothetical protein
MAKDRVNVILKLWFVLFHKLLATKWSFEPDKADDDEYVF